MEKKTKFPVTANQLKEARSNLSLTNKTNPTMSKLPTADNPTISKLPRAGDPTFSKLPTAPTAGNPAVSKLSKANDPTVSKLSTAGDPTVSKLSTAGDPTVSKLSTAGDPTVSKLSTTDNPTVSKLPTTDNPTVSKLPTTDNPTISKLPTTGNPTASKLPTTSNPTASKLSTASNPTASKLPTASNPTASKLPTASNPTASKLPTAGDPTVSKLPTAGDPTVSKLPTAGDPTMSKIPTASTPSVQKPSDSDPSVEKLHTADDPNIKIEPAEEKLPNTENNFDDLITDPLRKSYVIAPLKGQSNTYATWGDDNELRLLKVNPAQTVYSKSFHTLVNVRQDITRSGTSLKLVKAGSILKGKAFNIDMAAMSQKIKTNKLRLEGVGKDASSLTDDELKEKKENSSIEKLDVKVTWVAPNIYNNKRNIKVQTEQGMTILISLLNPQYETVHEDEVYSFLHIEKTANWKSSSSLISEVAYKFRTTLRTEIHHIRNPSQAFKNLNKLRGKVVCIDQEIVIMDQCTRCSKTRINNICMQATCPDRGRPMPLNIKFVAKMAIIDEENNVQTVKIWSDQMMDLPTSNLVPDDELREVLILNNLERHYENRVILFKTRNFNYSTDDTITIYDVTISGEDFMDIA